MLNLHIVQAEYGDSFVIECGEPKCSKFILIDGGPEITYDKHLKSALTSLIPETGQPHLIVCTHIDKDHICGVNKLLREIKGRKKNGTLQTIKVEDIWHNTFNQNIGIESDIAPLVVQLAQQAICNNLFSLSDEVYRGFNEGEQTSKLAHDLGIPINDSFKDNLVISDTAPSPLNWGGLKIWVIGPSKEHLKKLQKKWLAWLEKNKTIKRITKKDTSVPNLSSIALLIEEDKEQNDIRVKGKTILLTGDSTGIEILEGLKSLGRLDSSGKINVDIFKIPHHGSIRNVSEEFFEKVTSHIYIISANGQNGNPDTMTLEWIRLSALRQNRTIQIIATNETDSMRDFVQKYNLGDTVTYMKPELHYFTV